MRTNTIRCGPYAAKRLMILLNNVMVEHEKRFGQLNLEARPPEPRPAASETH